MSFAYISKVYLLFIFLVGIQYLGAQTFTPGESFSVEQKEFLNEMISSSVELRVYQSSLESRAFKLKGLDSERDIFQEKEFFLSLVNEFNKEIKILDEDYSSLKNQQNEKLGFAANEYLVKKLLLENYYSNHLKGKLLEIYAKTNFRPEVKLRGLEKRLKNILAQGRKFYFNVYADLRAENILYVHMSDKWRDFLAYKVSADPYVSGLYHQLREFILKMNEKKSDSEVLIKEVDAFFAAQVVKLNNEISQMSETIYQSQLISFDDIEVIKSYSFTVESIVAKRSLLHSFYHDYFNDYYSHHARLRKSALKKFMREKHHFFENYELLTQHLEEIRVRALLRVRKKKILGPEHEFNIIPEEERDLVKFHMKNQ